MLFFIKIGYVGSGSILPCVSLFFLCFSILPHLLSFPSSISLSLSPPHSFLFHPIFSQEFNEEILYYPTYPEASTSPSQFPGNRPFPRFCDSSSDL